MNNMNNNNNDDNDNNNNNNNIINNNNITNSDYKSSGGVMNEGADESDLSALRDEPPAYAQLFSQGEVPPPSCNKASGSQG